MLEDSDSLTMNARQPDSAAATSAPSGVTVSSNAAPASGSSASSLAKTKAQQNAAILQASLDVSIQAKNQPLALLLKSAINGINEQLKSQFGDNAIQAAASQDNTPAGTADRIVSISTGFFEAFKQQHPGEKASDVLTKFMSTIRSGFEKGAKEAQGILKDLGVLSGDIASNIDKTIALVQKGYADFEAAQGGGSSSTTSAGVAASAST